MKCHSPHPCEEVFGLKRKTHNGALGGDSGDKVGGCYLGWLLANGCTTEKNCCDKWPKPDQLISRQVFI